MEKIEKEKKWRLIAAWRRGGGEMRDDVEFWRKFGGLEAEIEIWA